MKQVFSISISVVAWFAVIAQLWLMIENRVEPVGETVIRFISFFTILTNTLVASFFTLMLLNRRPLNKSGLFTAITVYIFIVGIVYQSLLRHEWQPTGMQRFVDELLHSVIPLMVLIYWIAYESSQDLKYSFVPLWLVYPFVYLCFIMIRGYFSGFYPYPFVDVNDLGVRHTIINSALLIVFFMIVSVLFIFIARIIKPLKNLKS